MRSLTLLLLVILGCRLPGPLAGGASEIREGSFPSHVQRFLTEDSGARADTVLLPASARDSGAVYVLVINGRGLALRNAEVAVVPPQGPVEKPSPIRWQPVDKYGVHASRHLPGEYTVFVRDPFSWEAKKVVRLHAGAIDTLLAVMRSGAESWDSGLRGVTGRPELPPR